jgi:hypothetical protein
MIHPVSRTIRQTLRILPLLPLLVLLPAACRVLKPEKPAEEYSPVSYAPRDSYINIPLGTDVKTLGKLVNREMKGLIYSDTSFDNNSRDDLMLRATISDSIRISIDRNQLSYRVPLKIWLRKKLTAGLLGYSYSTTQDAAAEIALRFRTTVNVNRDWSLNTVTVSDGYDWISYPQVMAGLMQLPLPFVSDLLLNANLPKISREIDRAIKETVNLKAVMTETWTRMQKPVLISPDYSLWLRLTPVEISSVPIRAKGSFISHSVGLKARVELFYGSEPEYTVNPVLPPLKITSSIPESFSINLSLDIPFARINEMAVEKLKGYAFSYLKYRVTVTDISLYGKGENLIVALDLDGSVKGRIYLSGVPVYDPATLSIGLSGLDFHVDTRNMLTKTASWLFRSGLVRKLEPYLVYPVGEQLAEARNTLRVYMGRDQSRGYFRIRGDIDKLEPDKVLITPASVKAYFRFEGKISVGIQPG